MKKGLDPRNAPLQKLTVPQKLEGRAHEFVGKKPLDAPKRKRRNGHPSRQWEMEHPREPAIREINRMHREAIRTSPEEDGLIRGPIEVVAKLAAQEHAENFGMDDPETVAALSEWLVGRIAAAVRTVDLDEYEAWREHGRHLEG